MADVEVTHWGTVAGVLDRTGKTVAEEKVVKAAAQIELVTGAVYAFASTLLNKLDAYWMTAAVEYQAAWLADQPDMYDRLDISAASQDGQSATLKPDAIVVAPLARRALKRLSWRGTRSLRPVSPGLVGAVGGRVLPAGAPSHDYDAEKWTPLSLPGRWQRRHAPSCAAR